ncbi:hypothetical protein EDD68_10522 [Melghiribacillus thermohalophilus]|uniref:Uncharacterized protein n=1 Tax=Melghiribacillus thermohalophilus TaxID=1324956 RepID=A0A4R3N5S2_9BACI|nr:hypothetical protein [Melghiribacillus thermohalophilus]TCT24570.1 hypothetical protein EDD68_10522 [Melghiribacillus thermohalophilus]
MHVSNQNKSWSKGDLFLLALLFYLLGILTAIIVFVLLTNTDRVSQQGFSIFC